LLPRGLKPHATRLRPVVIKGSRLTCGGGAVRHFFDLDDAEQEAISLAVAKRVAASGAASVEELAAKEAKTPLALWAEIAVRAMAKMLERPETDLHVEVRDGDIVVTMPGTSFRAVYRKPRRAPARTTKLDSFQNQQ
jgi:hypothetical protein